MTTFIPATQLADRYEVGSPIGDAAASTVHRAHDRRLQRDVAIKLVDTRALDDDGRERLMRATQAASTINHPNVVHVHDLGTDGDVVFIVMELLPGRSLADDLAVAPLPVERADTLAADVAGALAAAHRRGVTHGNLTPDKVLLRNDGHFAVTGFGLGTDPAQATAAADMAALDALVSGALARHEPDGAVEDATVALPLTGGDATTVLPLAATAASAVAGPAATSITRRRTRLAVVAAIVVGALIGLALLASATRVGTLTPPTTLPPTTAAPTVSVLPTTTPPTTVAPAPHHGKHDKEG